MPHFVIECNTEVIEHCSAEELMQTVHQVAVDSQLFDLPNIKVRIKTYDQYLVAGAKSDFLHIFANIMEGRSIDQRAELSKTLVSELKKRLPHVGVISVNIWEFEKAAYANLKSLG